MIKQKAETEYLEMPLIIPHKKTLKEISADLFDYLPLLLIVFMLIIIWFLWKLWGLVNG